eukprot:8743713-Ditylum_brightwellii.AAC.1
MANTGIAPYHQGGDITIRTINQHQLPENLSKHYCTGNKYYCLNYTVQGQEKLHYNNYYKLQRRYGLFWMVESRKDLGILVLWWQLGASFYGKGMCSLKEITIKWNTYAQKAPEG